jgi:hypothetical protein
MTMIARISRWALLPISGLALLGCGPGGGGGAPVEGDTFLAFASSFKDFRTWESFPVDEVDDATVHTTGPRVEYLNERPDDGSSAFPVRTIIVKEFTEGALADRKVFAMVKRGGDYNLKGAAGWEWFELQNLDDSTVDIVWRGVGPPVGEKYGGDPNASCNSCHKGAANNDFVR